MNRVECALYRLASLAVIGMLATGCYTTTIHSGRPVSPATIGYDQRWHHGLFAGMAELSPAYDLSQVCPQGWAEVETEESFANGLAGLFSSPYSAQNVTIRCSTPAPPTAAPAAPPTATPAAPLTAAPAAPPTAAPAAPLTAAPAAPLTASQRPPAPPPRPVAPAATP
jgi:hypothetical protein